jgi:hypothetical protein
MASQTRNEETNTVTFKIEDAGAFHCFQQGMNDRKHWNRHPETRELQDLVVNNNKHSHIVIQYQDAYIPLKKI